MANNDNKWVGYNARSYDTIKSQIIASMRTLVPEITDYNRSNILIRLVEMFAGIAAWIHFYIDRIAQEVYLLTLRKFKNAVLFAKAYNYRIKGAFPAEVSQRFYVDTLTTVNIPIPIGTVISTQAGVLFETIESGQISIGQTQTFIRALQRKKTTIATVLGSGLANQKIVLNELVIDNAIEIKIDSVAYFPQETFAYSTAADFHFVASINELGLMEILFGDGINGFIPALNANIEVSYYECLGTLGNVSENSINSLLIPIGTVKTENLDIAYGGANAEDLEVVRKKLPLFIRTLERAVTREDFKDLAELIVGVEKAGVIFECGTPAEIYISPQGGGLASQYLIDYVSDIFDKRRTINVETIIKSAGVVRLVYAIDIVALPQFTNTDVKNSVLANLLAFHSPNIQNIQGSLFIGDLYEVIENTVGVRRSTINLIEIMPYARSLNNSIELNWQRIVKVGSTTTQKWKIKIISLTEYELYKDTTLQATYTINAPISLTEIDFTVLGASYVIGSEYEFYTYPYISRMNDTLQLVEPSILATFESNITLTVSGGI
jgi:Baseplate J-like protein